MKPSSKFDIIVYGATGFTGQLVAEYLAAHYTGEGAPKWAMAGRSLDKLVSVRDAIGAPLDTSLIVADASDPASPLEGVGRFNVESYLLSWIGLPERNFNAADVYTCRWLFDGLFPAFMLVVVSYLPLGRVGRTAADWQAAQSEQKARDDRFFVKMKTKVIPDWDADLRELESRYAQPQSLDHLKLFPNSSWEFTKWTWDESLGFAVCWVIAFAILGLLWAVVSIGA